MNIAARLFGSHLSRSLRSTDLSSVNSIGTIFKSKSLYTIPLLFSRATLSTTSTPDGVVSVIPASDVNRGNSTVDVKSSALVGPSTGRDERIVYLEKVNIKKELELSEVVKEIKELSSKRNSLIEKSKLTKIEKRQLKIIEEQDLPDLRKNKDRLAEELSNNSKEIISLRTSLPTVQPEKGKQHSILSYSISYS
jgi:hypothetical protein